MDEVRLRLSISSSVFDEFSFLCLIFAYWKRNVLLDSLTTDVLLDRNGLSHLTIMVFRLRTSGIRNSPKNNINLPYIVLFPDHIPLNVDCRSMTHRERNPGL